MCVVLGCAVRVYRSRYTSIKTRIETTLKTETEGGHEALATLPSKQGLKLANAVSDIEEKIRSRYTSIKTRIETDNRHADSKPLGIPLATLPSKHGLKPGICQVTDDVRLTLATLPSKQGLKRDSDPFGLVALIFLSLHFHQNKD